MSGACRSRRDESRGIGGGVSSPAWRIRTELSLRLQNSPGALGHICQHLSDERVNILALHLEAGGAQRLVVDNPLRAAGILEEQKHTVETRDVLVREVKRPLRCDPARRG